MVSELVVALGQRQPARVVTDPGNFERDDSGRIGLQGEGDQIVIERQAIHEIVVIRSFGQGELVTKFLFNCFERPHSFTGHFCADAVTGQYCDGCFHSFLSTWLGLPGAIIFELSDFILLLHQVAGLVDAFQDAMARKAVDREGNSLAIGQTNFAGFDVNGYFCTWIGQQPLMGFLIHDHRDEPVRKPQPVHTRR